MSGEINTKVDSVSDILAKAKEKYADGELNEIDGVSMEFSDWRFNLRGSNTEPLIRLNVEAKNQELVDEKTKELLDLVKG